MAIHFRRTDSVGGGLLEKNSFARREIFAVDNLDGHFTNCTQPNGDSNRSAKYRRGNRLRVELYFAAVDCNSGALHFERTTNRREIFRHHNRDNRYVCFDGLAGRRRLERGVYPHFRRNIGCRYKHHCQVAADEMRHDSADDVANNFRRNFFDDLLDDLSAGRN